MFNRISKFKYLFKLIIFIPLIFSFGKRSYITFDEGLESIDELKKSELVWTTDLQKINNNNFSIEVINEDDTLKPWKLILKN